MTTLSSLLAEIASARFFSIKAKAKKGCHVQHIAITPRATWKKLFFVRSIHFRSKEQAKLLNKPKQAKRFQSNDSPLVFVIFLLFALGRFIAVSPFNAQTTGRVYFAFLNAIKDLFERLECWRYYWHWCQTCHNHLFLWDYGGHLSSNCIKTAAVLRHSPSALQRSWVSEASLPPEVLKFSGTK